jgi:hypothetical protein
VGAGDRGDARLRFGPEGLGVEFVCGKPGSSEVLRQGSAELRTALAASGLHLNKVAAKDG